MAKGNEGLGFRDGVGPVFRNGEEASRLRESEETPSGKVSVFLPGRRLPRATYCNAVAQTACTQHKMEGVIMQSDLNAPFYHTPI